MISKVAALTLVGIGALLCIPSASAQTSSSANQLVINTFNGVYHLTRDNRGLSLLTTEETIIADFPSAGFYGIKREIPKSYLNHNVDVKVLNVSDVAANPVAYKTSNDGDNLVITTGDPAIKLYGTQTIKIRYQTSGVINLGQKSDELLLNVNGRGWDTSIANIDATVYISSDLKAALNGDPSCYTSLDKSAPPGCQINTQKSSQNTVVTAKARLVPAHQSLVLKMDFAASTFTNNHGFWSKNWLLVVGALVITAASVSAYVYLAKKK